jgi:hypothetical protein
MNDAPLPHRGAPAAIARLSSAWRGYWPACLIFLAALAALWLMGRLPICACGTVKLWYSAAGTSETSQHLSDWYTLSHVIHGFLFYAAIRLVLRDWAPSSRFALAMAIECAWEVLENTSFIIDRYREVTVSWGYYGDSIVNSAGDILAMAAGFALAARLPVWATVVIGLFLELLAGYVIRDNLSLNILMLLWPLDSVRQWQMMN